MNANPPIVIENRWVPWGDVTGERGAAAAAAGQVAVLKAGNKIKKRLGLRADPFRFRGGAGGIEFQAVGIAGTLSLREISIEIVPKFVSTSEQLPLWNTSTLFLLDALAGKNVIPMLAYRQQWKSHRVVDLIAHAFADAAERGLRDQPIQIYKHSEETTVVLRGRLNITRQLRNMVHAPHMLECDIDQLNVENPFNDVLKWAATVLEQSVREIDLKARLRGIAHSIPGHAERSVTQRHHRLLPPPQFHAWSDALELSRLLASGMTLSGNGGNSTGYSLLFNMERAFERFVEIALARALKLIGDASLTSTRQDRINYGEPDYPGGNKLYCRPDNIVRRLGSPLIVVDAKYKLLDRDLSSADDGSGRPNSQDIYELVAGMFASHCHTGLLIYPMSKLSGDESPKIKAWHLSVFGTNVRVCTVPVNLLSLHSRSELSRLIKFIADQILLFSG